MIIQLKKSQKMLILSLHIKILEKKEYTKTNNLNAGKPLIEAVFFVSVFHFIYIKRQNDSMFIKNPTQY